MQVTYVKTCTQPPGVKVDLNEFGYRWHFMIKILKSFISRYLPTFHLLFVVFRQGDGSVESLRSAIFPIYTCGFARGQIKVTKNWVLHEVHDVSK